MMEIIVMKILKPFACLYQKWLGKSNSYEVFNAFKRVDF